jgi:hypothetical protein
MTWTEYQRMLARQSESIDDRWPTYSRIVDHNVELSALFPKLLCTGSDAREVGLVHEEEFDLARPEE